MIKTYWLVSTDREAMVSQQDIKWAIYFVMNTRKVSTNKICK